MYAYLLFSLTLIVIWCCFFIIRKDLRHKLFITGLLGGIAGLLAEIWYFKDYWHPPTILGNSKISLEDFLFGFAITGISACIYDVFFKKKSVKDGKNHKKLFVIYFAFGFAMLIVFTNIFKINSILVTSILFLIISSFIVVQRRDLLGTMIISGILMIIIIIPIYTIFLDFWFPHQWEKYWLLSNTVLGIKILGEIPLTELLWYFSWGCLAGIAYEFTLGYKKITIRN